MNAINAYNKLNANVAGLKKASEKLASGYRINRAGDDAAGLAISEKMRSQIKGLNQAIRNSQDGINMIQTFEGAAQETHNILQRMKELATESANGTYDNATDRAAIELEFQQLNDELNQIADTDFNGTLVLNGGVMADGRRAADGAFNYTDKTQSAEYLAAHATDISGKYADSIADQTKYNKEIADKIWKATGVSSKYDAIDVTFTYDGSEWKATSICDTDGKVIEGTNGRSLIAKSFDRDGATGKGGFEVYVGEVDDDNYATNAVFNEFSAKSGDTVTLRFLNTTDTTRAPEGINIAECRKDNTPWEIDDAAKNISATQLNKAISVSLHKDVTDKAMEDENLKKVLDLLKMCDIEVEYAAGTVDDTSTKVKFTLKDGATAPDGVAVANLKMDGNTLVYEDTTNNISFNIATLKFGDIEKDLPAHTDYKFENTATVGSGAQNAGSSGDMKAAAAVVNTTTLEKALEAAGITNASSKITISEGTNANSFKIVDDKGKTLADNVTYADLKSTWGITLNDADGGEIAGGGAKNAGFSIDVATTVTATDVPAGMQTDTSAEGKVKFSLNIDNYNYADLGKLTVHSVKTPDAATMKGQLGAGTSSKSDAFGQSTAILTYADHIILQTGARTKDAVDFTFAYNTNGSADMGTLKANLDLSSRANGLNTANLTLANQKDANYAIDQIDKAINKTSMVRATFGAIQNRLEHKITNLTTTSENLTEAESSIRDTDMAQEMMNYTKFNILQQAAQSMLAQANQQPQSILQLLG